MTTPELTDDVVLDVPVDQMMPDPGNPRQNSPDDELLPLGHCMRESGQQQPVTVRLSPPGAPAPYTLRSGHRRWAAAKLVGMTTLKAVLFTSGLAGKDTLIAQLAENRARKSLTPIEDVEAVARAKELNPELTSRQLADRTGYSESEVSRLLTIHACSVARQALADGRLKGVADAYPVAKAPADQKDALIAMRLGGATSRSVAKAARPKRAASGVKVTRVKLVVNGATITVTGREMDGEQLAEIMSAGLDAVRKGNRDGLDVETLVRVLADKATRAARK